MPKPGGDFTDLIPVTTATGQPLSPAESANDVLGSIVREHLQRAASPKLERKEETKAAPDIETDAAADVLLAQISELTDGLKSPEPDAVAEAPSRLAGEAGGGQKVDLAAQASDPAAVQKEFDALFAGASGAGAAGSSSGEAGVDPEGSRLSSEELNALLAQGEKPAAEEVASAAPQPAEMEGADKALTEAEGVLQEELAQLMAAPEAPAAAVAAPVAATPVAPAVEVAPAPVPPVVVIVKAPVEVEVSPRARWLVLTDAGLMAGQLLDLPFSWISIAEKNLIGVAAFLLLLGGAVLWILSWMM